MAKKKKKLISDLIDDISNDINIINTKREIPDIITFVESSEWLGLPVNPTNPINIYPVQRIMLKVFYRGSEGNENIELTEREIELCKNIGLDNDSKGDFLGKYYSKFLFRELLLVWGRRASKDFVCSIIALYESMKLLECPGGDPYAMYELSSANPINILTIANAKPQAAIAFMEIKEKLLQSNYFKDKYIKDGISAGAIYLLTPKDKKDNIEFKEKGLPLKKGSIGIVVGHSNSDTLLGMGCIVLILDEVASYKATGGSSSGDRIYTALTPMTKTYVRRFYKKDENNNIILDENGQKIVEKRIYDGKIISISSPRAKEGKFYEMFRDARNVSNRLVMRLPTWEVNPTHTRASLKEEATSMSETEFNMEYGAEFSGTGLESFFTEDQVKSCFIGHSRKLVEIGSPGNVYFVHLDPATSSHNYGLVILHKEFYLNKETMKSEFMIIVDQIKYWEPVRGPIDVEEVTEYVVGLKRKFRIGLLTYDAFQSQESIVKIRKAGISQKETKFTGIYKMKIYRELENLVNSRRILIPHHNLLYNEMVELQRKFTPTGFKILPKKEGDGAKSDDLCVVPETVVHTNKGATFIKDVLIGDNILTHDGTYQKIIGFSEHSPNDSLIKVKPYYGLPVIATKNHIVEVFSNKNEEKIWKRCDELTLKDKLVRSFCTKKKKFTIDLLKYVNTKISKYNNVEHLKDGFIRSKNANGKWHYNKISSTPDFGYICGIYLAEGSLADYGVSFGFHIDETRIHKKLDICFKNTFNILPTKPFKQKIGKGCQITVNSQIIKYLFKDIFEGRLSINKRIPLKLMQAPLKFQKELIKGLFDGDGCICEKRIVFTTTSRLLANQIQQILLRFKIVSSISLIIRKGKIVFIRGRKSKYNADLCNIMITDSISFNKLSKILEVNKTKKQSIYHKPKYFFKENRLIANIYKIENYIDKENKDVINISVDNNNSYVSESLNSHNCDCLAGAAYIAIEKQVSKLPNALLVEHGNLAGQNTVWRNMQGGIYGVGPGGQVARKLEQRASWPNYKRF